MTATGHSRVSVKHVLVAWVAPGLLLLTMAFGTVLRLHLLSKRDLWVDESLGVFLGKLPWRDFWQALWNFQANMSFYYLLLRGWLQLGDGEMIVRGMSVLFGVATIPAVYVLGKHCFGYKAAIAAAALSTVNVFDIRYSQEARGYSLLMLLAVLATYFFVRAVTSPDRKRYWVGYVLACALGVYVHLFTYLLIAAHWLCLGYTRLRLLPRQALLSAAAGFLLLTAPMDAFILFRDRGQLSWVPRPTVQQVLEFSKFFTGNGSLLLVAAYAAVCLVALSGALFRPAASQAPESPGFDERWFVKLVAMWLLFPIVSTLLISLIKPVFYDRFMSISAPALTLLAAQGMANLDQMWPRFRGLFPATLLVFLGLSLWGIHRYDSSSASEGDDWRQAIHYMIAGQQPGDVVFFYRASAYWPFEYYASREAEEHGSTAVPTVVFPLDKSNPDQQPDEQQARLAIQGQKRVWLVLQHYESPQERQVAVDAILNALRNGYRVSQEQVFSGRSGPIRVVLYERAANP
jgi:mannosyltransferase